ncbi:LacI family DNA-binding transcriptional regulator [Mycobacterium sp. AT1]|uniref:LacI family DNA-binding transcriptional regulator n=1 Tax=Mycobacterium sp. AT1 TaxID=1961706 RepID=UPI0009AEE749|nr:substrate-binding domain-containing protein [Mycobacterium sp. AT1]OPX08660.1 LacI family transcriptional regulator [Mycobacterium sp. AT1]
MGETSRTSAQFPAPVTLRVIAEEIGVSVSTVSRVLKAEGDDATRWASAETVARIRAYAKSREYRPHPHAASLRTARSGLVGVLVPRLQDFVLATVYEGVEEAATEHGYSTFVTNSLDDPANKAQRTEMMLQRRVEGIIFGDAHHHDPLLSALAERGTPFVLVSRRSGDYVSATCDDLLGGALVGRHLVEAGRRDLAVLAGLPFASTAIERTTGAVDAFTEAGLRVAPERIEWGPFDAAGGRQAAEKILSRRPYPDAIFATNDFAAIGALGVLRDHGLRVPDDIALIGYNDTPLVAEMPTPLTTVRSPMHEMGRRGIELLIELLGGGTPDSERLTPELVVRQSG